MNSQLAVDPAVLEELTKKYRDLQERLEQATSSQGQLSAQEVENKIVLEELEGMEEDAQVYKMVGAVLAKQTKAESIENVRKRLQFIADEIERNQKAAATNKAELDKLVEQLQKYQAPA